LDTQITAAQKRLEKGGDEDISKLLKSLTSAGFSLANGINLNAAVDVYKYALDGLSAHAMTIVTRKLIRGEYEDTRPFIPSPPEFATLVRREMSYLQADVADLKLRKDSIASANESRTREKTEEEKARVREMIAKFHAESQANDALATDEPIDEERAEYWRKIMELKDAPEKNEDFTGFRNQIAKYVSDADKKRSA
jgi:hypothetical protein